MIRHQKPKGSLEYECRKRNIWKKRLSIQKALSFSGCLLLEKRYTPKVSSLLTTGITTLTFEPQSDGLTTIRLCLSVSPANMVGVAQRLHHTEASDLLLPVRGFGLSDTQTTSISAPTQAWWRLTGAGSLRLTLQPIKPTAHRITHQIVASANASK